MSLLSLLLAIAAHAGVTPVRQAYAHVKVTRSYVTWSSPSGEIRYETVCEKELAVPVYDFRDHPELRPQAERGELTCTSLYRDQAVPIEVRGVVELVRAGDFGLALPEPTELKRSTFVLDVGVGEGFPYLPEVQSLAGFQLFTEDLGLRSELFALSPEAYISITCSEGKCEAHGPQSVFRAQVRLLDPAP